MDDNEPKPRSIEIVNTTPDLWELYREIRLKGLLEEPQAFGRTFEEEMAYPKEKWLQRAGNPYSFIATENGVPVGMMGAFISDESGERTATIVGVFVSKDARGKGIGSELLGAVLDKIQQDPGIKRVNLTVNKDQAAAVRLYEKFGFRITGEETQTLGDGKEHAEYRMELVL